ncbi:hypothetical protein WAI453_002261 [Rhynchosporium graminicola]|uniref:Uncharacterized protein n=1 Tax=Rhynchosporium graminicola TaxID=2792576 RepID=A0A1E1LC18_9HELO|nr:uncharacterized protein RCO7_09564 [Rhynchosporium commune]
MISPKSQARQVQGGKFQFQEMAVMIPHIKNGTPEASLFFISDDKITRILGTRISTDLEASDAPFLRISDPSPAGHLHNGTSVISELIEHPPLLAVTCFNPYEDKPIEHRRG